LDKDGIAIPFWEAIGFGAIEVGTVTAKAQSGNEKPRLFRLIPEEAIINRMGFNNKGTAALSTRLKALKESGKWPKVPVGVNIGKSKVVPNEHAIEDYLESIQLLQDLPDYLTLNVSSPNTPGLRALQEKEPLQRLLEACIRATRLPVFLKLAPDLEDSALIEAVEVAIQSGVTAIIATNTTLSRPGTTGRLNEPGGLSGKPLWPLAKQKIGVALQAASGRIPVVGVGGISEPEQVEELLKMGCAATQLYSALIFQGPGLVTRINQR
jgi:dihydroorotate dehydrogenase